jgi:hypothetical protein
MTAKEYFKEEISGEPLTEEWIIYHLKAFAKIKCKEQIKNKEILVLPKVDSSKVRKYNEGT